MAYDLTSGARECPRCGGGLQTSIMSKFDQSIICWPCKDRERKHPDYAAVDAEEVASVLRGEYNWEGPGAPADLFIRPNDKAEPET